MTNEVERWSSEYHAPVLAGEVLRLLHGASRVLDGTLGGGGHTAALLDAGAHVTAFDRDPSALKFAAERLQSAVDAGRLELHQLNYTDLERPDVLPGRRFQGILLDLGVSSRQLDDPSRGFSYREGTPLDMRMGDDAGSDAATLLNEEPERTLENIFRRYGDEPRARRLATEIVRRRAREPFATSDDLVRAIRGALGPRSGAGDFARLFQAVRIAVNDELDSLERALPALRDRLEPGGVIAVIAYHSGEDRLVKHAFREWSRSCVCPVEQMMCTCRGRPLGELLTRKAIEAAEGEVKLNVRARSARLRAWKAA